MATHGVIPVLECLLNRGAHSEEETRFFQDVAHDVLVNTLHDYLNNHRHFLGYCQIEVHQALNEKGVDVIVTTNDCKVGFQIKSHFDVTENDFSTKVKRQFAESFSHALNYYFILICAPLVTDDGKDYRGKINHIKNELSLFRNVSFDVYGPQTTVGIFREPPKVSREELLLRKAITDECLHEHEKGYEHLPAVDDDELRALAEVVDSFGDELELFESEEGMRALDEYEEFVLKKEKEQFVSTFLPTLPPDVAKRRTELVAQAQFLLTKCRKCKSWDDKSELKLSSWVEHVPEVMIPCTSLPNLLRIVENLKEYLEIHRRMDRELEETS